MDYRKETISRQNSHKTMGIFWFHQSEGRCRSLPCIYPKSQPVTPCHPIPDSSLLNPHITSTQAFSNTLHDLAVDNLSKRVLLAGIVLLRSSTGSFTVGIVIKLNVARREGRLHSLSRSRQENDLGVRGLCHGLVCFEGSDLHGRCRGKNIS